MKARISLLAAALLLLAACARKTVDAAVQLEVTGEVEAAPFSDCVRAETVQFADFLGERYVFSDDAAAEKAQQLVSPDGMQIQTEQGAAAETVQVPVHWYRSGAELLRLWCGDLKQLEAVRAAWGAQVAGFPETYTEEPSLESPQLLALQDGVTTSIAVPRMLEAVRAALPLADWTLAADDGTAAELELDFMNGTACSLSRTQARFTVQAADGARQFCYALPDGAFDALVQALHASPFRGGM